MFVVCITGQSEEARLHLLRQKLKSATFSFGTDFVKMFRCAAFVVRAVTKVPVVALVAAHDCYSYSFLYALGA